MPAPKKRVRVQPLTVQLDPSLLVWLRGEADRRDTSIADVIRCAVRELRERTRCEHLLAPLEKEAM